MDPSDLDGIKDDVDYYIEVTNYTCLSSAWYFRMSCYAQYA